MNAGKTYLEKSASEAFSAISIMLGSTNGTMLLLVHSLQRLGKTRCMFTRWTTNDQQVISIDINNNDNNILIIIFLY